jgi:hypothetical protein
MPKKLKLINDIKNPRLKDLLRVFGLESENINEMKNIALPKEEEDKVIKRYRIAKHQLVSYLIRKKV